MGWTELTLAATEPVSSMLLRVQRVSGPARVRSLRRRNYWSPCQQAGLRTWGKKQLLASSDVLRGDQPQAWQP